MQIPTQSIRIDDELQPREKIDKEVVVQYAEDMERGDQFPPVVVFRDGDDYWIADGFHRYFAHRHLKRPEIEADVREGTRRDAILHSVGANATHGIRRTNADKRRAVQVLLSDEEWAQWSDREVARRCNVHNSFVSRLRPSLSHSNSERTYVTRHGTTAVMNTANIGKPRAADLKNVPSGVVERFEVEQLPTPMPSHSPSARNTLTVLAALDRGWLSSPEELAREMDIYPEADWDRVLISMRGRIEQVLQARRKLDAAD